MALFWLSLKQTQNGTCLSKKSFTVLFLVILLHNFILIHSNQKCKEFDSIALCWDSLLRFGKKQEQFTFKCLLIILCNIFACIRYLIDTNAQWKSETILLCFTLCIFISRNFKLLFEEKEFFPALVRFYFKSLCYSFPFLTSLTIF